MTRDELLDALMRERYNGAGWRTPGWAPPSGERSPEDELAGRRRLREVDAEAKTFEKEGRTKCG